MSEQNYDCRSQMKRNFNVLARELPVMIGESVDPDVVQALSASAESIAAWDVKSGGNDSLAADYAELKAQLLRGFKAVSREANVLAGQSALTAKDVLAATAAMNALRILDETAEKLTKTGAAAEKGDNVIEFGDGRRLQPGVPSLGQR